jgi:hypothetical protein
VHSLFQLFFNGNNTKKELHSIAVFQLYTVGSVRTFMLVSKNGCTYARTVRLVCCINIKHFTAKSCHSTLWGDIPRTANTILPCLKSCDKKTMRARAAKFSRFVGSNVFNKLMRFHLYLFETDGRRPEKLCKKCQLFHSLTFHCSKLGKIHFPFVHQ